MTIYIRNLIKTYYLKNECKNVLTGVNLEIRAGQIFGLMGQNGSGKTTLLKILSTLILPTNGNVEICGFNIEDHPAKTRQSIGLSADPDTSFYQILSLRENIKFYGRLLDVEKDILDKRIDEFCEIFGLKEFFDVKLSQCPSGIKQKLAVIRAFLHEPEVLLIDEPARSLDEGSKLKILEFIRSVVKEKNKTCIMVTHALDEAKRFADRIGDTNLIIINVTSSNPQETVKIANATAEVYIEKGIEDKSRRAKELREFIEVQMKEAQEKLKNSEDTLKVYTEKSKTKGLGSYLSSRLISLETRKSELSEKYTEEHPEIKLITQQLEETKEQMKSLPANELEYARLSRELAINEQLYTLLAKRYKEAQISEADRVQNAFVVTPAVEPTSPISPNKRLNITVGAFLGIFLGFIFALIIENLDTSIGTIEDVEKFLDLPVLGIIPHVEVDSSIKSLFIKERGRHERTDYLRGKLIAYHSSKSPFVESYHTLRTNLKLTFLKENGKILAFTSAGISEGKTLTAVNFAIAAAQSGIKTLVMETDLRRPSIHWVFGLPRTPGFSDCIVGNKNWPEVVKTTTDFLLGDLGMEKILKIPGIENLSLITSGPMVSNPIDLLNSPKTKSMIKELAQTYDLVILDCPPVLLFADALIIGTHTDGNILVYQVGRMARRALKRAKDQLANVKAPIIGVVLNNVKTSEMGSYYGYGYYYSYKYYAKGEIDDKNIQNINGNIKKPNNPA